MKREDALKFLHDNMKNQNLIRHCYAVEAVMRALAEYFNEDKEIWGIAGLLHDADYELTKDNPQEHTHKTVSWLKEAGFDHEIINAVLAHGWKFVDGNPRPQNKMEWSLYTCDELTGLIVAVALVKGKKLANVKVSSILKKFPEKAFASGVHREQIKLCEEKLNISLNQYIDIALKAMQKIHKDIAL